MSTLYGSLKAFDNVGQTGIKTSGKYQEPVARGSHAEELNKEHAKKALYGKKIDPSRNYNCTINLEAVRRIQKANKITETKLQLGAKMNNNTFARLISGNKITIHNLKMVASSLGCTIKEIQV